MDTQTGLGRTQDELFQDERQSIAGYEDDRNRLWLESMESGGFVVFEPLADELQLDLDTQQSVDIFILRWPFLLNSFPNALKIVTDSKNAKTKGSKHGRVLLGPRIELDPRERIAWQSIMGSDPKREICNLHRIHFDIPRPVVLVETTVEAENITNWLAYHRPRILEDLL